MSMPFVSSLANSLKKKKIHVIQIRFTPKFQYWKCSSITLKSDTFLVGGDLIAVLLKAWYLRRLCRPNVMPRDPFPETQAFCSNVEAAILILLSLASMGSGERESHQAGFLRTSWKKSWAWEPPWGFSQTLPAPRENFSIKEKIPKCQHSPVRKTAVSFSILDEQNFPSSWLGLLDRYTLINLDLEVL